MSGKISRRLGPFADDQPGIERSLDHLYLNTGKKSITLDVESAEGVEMFRASAKDANAVVEGFTPGKVAVLGLGYDQLSTDNPGLVMTSVTIFGQDGPYSGYKGEEIITQSLSGNLQITGSQVREPLMAGGYLAQYAGGPSGCAATPMANMPTVPSSKPILICRTGGESTPCWESWNNPGPAWPTTAATPTNFTPAGTAMWSWG